MFSFVSGSCARGIFNDAGFITMTAYDGATDVVMPGISGVELAIMLTQSIPDVKILLFSGQASTVDLLEKARQSGYHFTALTKPVHPIDMLKRISECLATHKPIPPSSNQSHQTTPAATN